MTSQSMMADEGLRKVVLRKVVLRLIPFMFLLFALNILNRVNVGFARLQMLDELKLGEEVFGMGASVFFIGYFLFQIPSNLFLNRIGARLWIAGIVAAWGLISASMMLIRGQWSFYALRFLLGVAQAGFFPGMILYLTYWVPSRERAKVTACFITASAVAGIIGSPISGALMENLDQAMGLSGWQWMFLLQGLPTVFLGGMVIFWLTERPEVAEWLTPEQRLWLETQMQREQQYRAQQHGFTVWMALRNRRVWLLCFLYVSLAMVANTLGFYLPELVRGGFPDATTTRIGILVALPYLLSVVCMVLSGIHSDRTGERRWHVAVPAFLAAGGLMLAGNVQHPWLILAALSLAVAGTYCTFGPFWSLPNSFLSGAAAAAGIGLINSVGNLGGFIGPNLLSGAKKNTGSFSAGLMMLALILVAGGILAICTRHDREWNHDDMPQNPEP